MYMYPHIKVHLLHVKTGMNSRYNVLHAWQWKISLGLDISRC